MKGKSLIKRYRVKFQGTVQGIGFRYFVQDAAREHHITGWVRNNDDGSVETQMEGEDNVITSLIEHIKNDHPYAHVSHIEKDELPIKKENDVFRITF